MTSEQFKNLGGGDRVRHETTGNTYFVICSYGNRATAVRIADLTNPLEWELISKATHEHVK
jgi:hypothetical protein